MSTARFSSLALGWVAEMRLMAPRISRRTSVAVRIVKYLANCSMEEGALIAARVWTAASCCWGLPLSSIRYRCGTAASLPREAEALIAARLTSRSES